MTSTSGGNTSALDLQQLALQAQRFEKIEGLIQLLSQQTVDASNQAAARQAAIMCGIEEGSAVEHEELSALGLKLDRIQGSVDELKGLVTAKNERLRVSALARQDKERALEQFEVEPDSVEAEPFAKGAEGSVHKASYSEEDVALKKVNLAGMTAVERRKVLSSCATELAIMVKLRNPRVVQARFRRRQGDAIDADADLSESSPPTPRSSAHPNNVRADLQGPGRLYRGRDRRRGRRWLADIAAGMRYAYKKRRRASRSQDEERPSRWPAARLHGLWALEEPSTRWRAGDDGRGSGDACVHGARAPQREHFHGKRQTYTLSS